MSSPVLRAGGLAKRFERREALSDCTAARVGETSTGNSDESAR
jgi:hypothetical protein